MQFHRSVRREVVPDDSREGRSIGNGNVECRTKDATGRGLIDGIMYVLDLILPICLALLLACLMTGVFGWCWPYIFAMMVL